MYPTWVQCAIDRRCGPAPGGEGGELTKDELTAVIHRHAGLRRQQRFLGVFDLLEFHNPVARDSMSTKFCLGLREAYSNRPIVESRGANFRS